jgi:hypothetical protein
MNQDLERGKRELREAVHRLFNSLQEMEPILTDPMPKRIASLAEFAVRGRTQIPRGGYSKEIIYVPEPEAATRLAQQLAQLAKGSALLAGRHFADEKDYALTKRVAFDCIPGARRKILDCLVAGTDPSQAKLPDSSRSYAVEELESVELILSESKRSKLSPLARKLLEVAHVL